MLNGVASLGFQFEATDNASPVLKGIHTALKDVESAAKDAGASLDKLRVGRGGGGGGGGGGGKGGGFGDAAGGVLGSLARGLRGIGGFALSHVGGFGASMLATRVMQRQMVAGFEGMAPLLGPAGLAGKFEFTMAQLKGASKVAGETMAQETEKMRRFADVAIQAGIDTLYPPQQAAEAMMQLVRNGKSAEQAIKMLIPTLDLAAASFGKLSPEKAAETISIVTKQFGVGAQEAADKVVKLSQLSSMHVEQVMRFLPTIGSVSSSLFKQTLDDTLILGGMMRMSGMVPSRAGTTSQAALARAFQGKTVGKLEGFLGEKVSGPNGPKSILDVLEKVEIRMRSMNRMTALTKLKDIFGEQGSRAVGAFLNATREVNGRLLKGGELIKFMREQLAQSKGTAVAFREELLNTFEGAKKLFHGSVEALATLVGMDFAKGMTKTIRGITDVLNEFIVMIKKIDPETRKNFAQVLGLIGGILSFASGIFVARTAVGVFLPILGKMITSMVLLIPLLPVIAGLGAAFLALFMAVEQGFVGFGGSIGKTFEKVILFFRGLISLIRDGFIEGELLKKLDTPENKALLDFIVDVYAAFYRFQNFLRGFVHGVWAELHQPHFVETWEKLKAAVFHLLEAIGVFKPGDFENFLNSPSSTFFGQGIEFATKAVKLLERALVKITQGIDWAASEEGQRTMKEMWEGIKTVVIVVAGIFKGLFGIVKDVASVVIRLFGKDPDKEVSTAERIESAAKATKVAVFAIVGLKIGAFVLQLGSMATAWWGIAAAARAAATASAGAAAAGGGAAAVGTTGLLARLGPIGLALAPLIYGISQGGPGADLERAIKRKQAEEAAQAAGGGTPGLGLGPEAAEFDIFLARERRRQAKTADYNLGFNSAYDFGYSGDILATREGLGLGDRLPSTYLSTGHIPMSPNESYNKGLNTQEEFGRELESNFASRVSMAMAETLPEALKSVNITINLDKTKVGEGVFEFAQEHHEDRLAPGTQAAYAAHMP